MTENIQGKRALETYKDLVVVALLSIDGKKCEEMTQEE
jgi:hypothetical protein